MAWYHESGIVENKEWQDNFLPRNTDERSKWRSGELKAGARGNHMGGIERMDLGNMMRLKIAFSGLPVATVFQVTLHPSTRIR